MKKQKHIKEVYEYIIDSYLVSNPLRNMSISESDGMMDFESVKPINHKYLKCIVS
jgi:hypothetical protein